MKVYGVYYRDNENERDMRIFTEKEKEKAQKLFEQIKYAIELEFKDDCTANIMDNTNTKYSVYVECRDYYYEGQEYFVELKEFEI